MNDNRLMYFSEHTDIYWHGAFMGLAVLLGSALFWVFLRRIRSGAASALKYIIIFGYPLAVVLSRLEYCWFRQDEFRGGLADVLDVSGGGFALVGAMCAVAAVISVVGAGSRTFSAGELFDAAAPAAAAAIAVGRLASAFSSEERGFELYTDFFRKVMFTEYSAAEDRTFLLVYPYEAIFAAVIFIACILCFNAVYRRGEYASGTVAIRFVLGFTLTQILFESWRSDSLHLVTLGFVRVNQIFCTIVLVIMLVVLCVKYARREGGITAGQIGIWAATVGGLALAFICEFFMTGGNHLLNYSGMIVGLLAVYAASRILIGRVCAAHRRERRF